MILVMQRDMEYYLLVALFATYCFVSKTARFHSSTFYTQALVGILNSCTMLLSQDLSDEKFVEANVAIETDSRRIFTLRI